MQSLYNNNYKIGILDENNGYHRSHHFTLSIDLNSLSNGDVCGISIYDDNDFMKTYGIVNEIKGYLEDIPQVSYKTNVDTAKQIALPSLISSLTDNKFIKALAQQNTAHREVVYTDGWTQKMPTGSEPISFTLKFRSYPSSNNYNTNANSYNDIIKFLYFVTTPIKYNIENSVMYLNTAYSQMKNNSNHDSFINTLRDLNSVDLSSFDFQKFITNPRNYSFDKTDSEGNQDGTVNLYESLKKLISTGIDYFKQDQTMGGCPILNLDITNNYFCINKKIPLIIKSWSFKPSLNTQIKSESYKINIPLYIDFNINLETQYIPTDMDMN